MTTSRRTFVRGTAASAAIAPFLIGKSAHAGDAEFIMKVATVAPTGTTWANTVTKFKKHIDKVTGGRVKVKAYLGGALGDEIATAEATKRGTVQGWGGSMAALASAVPEIECFEAPYLFDSSEQAQRVLDTVRGRVHDLLWDRGYKLSFFSQNGYRNIGSTFAVNGLADLKGKKMRALQADVHLDTWRAFGASPVPMAVTEVLSSLQTGVVDGYDNTALFAFAAAWYVATTHFTLTEHIYQPAAVVVSRKFWEGLPADLQAALDPNTDEIRKMETRSFRSVDAMGPQLIQNFRDAGIKVVELDKAEKAKFVKAAQPVHGKFEKRTSKAGRGLFKAIKSAL
jgi:tripartite ATP-independent transporter DctP family solute receptor